jgi:hypothetical protein
MRTVSFFGPEVAGAGEGRTEADNGCDTAGGFGGGKKFVAEILSLADDDGEATGGVPVSRTGNWMRTVSCGFKFGCDGFATGGSGSWIRTVSFFGWPDPIMELGEIDQKLAGLSPANRAASQKMFSRQASRS